MYIAIAFLLLVFIVYNTWIYINYGILSSISASYYYDKKVPFLAFCWALGALMITISALQVGNQGYGLFFFSGAGLLFTGTAGAFKESLTDVVHYAGAVLAIVLGFIGLWVVGGDGFWIPGAVFILTTLIFIIITLENIVYWTEILAFLLILFGLTLLA